jgi:hypothetical protein
MFNEVLKGLSKGLIKLLEFNLKNHRITEFAPKVELEFKLEFNSSLTRVYLEFAKVREGSS